MEDLLIIGIIVKILVVRKISTERKVDNYDMSKVDMTKLNLDMVNGVSAAERRRRLIRGYYDKRQERTIEYGI